MMAADNLSKRRAITALALLVPAPTIGVAMGMVVMPGPIGQAFYFLSKIWIVALPLVWLLWVERGKISLSPMRHGGVGLGVGTGIAIFAVMVGVYLLLGPSLVDPAMIQEAAAKNHLDNIWVYLGMAVYIIAVNSLIEEYVWRWFVFSRCEAIVGKTQAVFLSAFFFTIHHIVALMVQMPWPAALISAAGVFTGGAIWSWLYLRTRSIWPGYISHIFADVAAFLIGWWLIFPSA